jgi:hypothetical protein
MKTHKKFLFALLLTLIISFAITPSVYASDGDDPGHVVFGSSYVLAENQTLQGDLVVFGGTALLEKGSVVKGDVVIAGGTLTVEGTITGDLTSFGGIVNLRKDARIYGNAVRFGGILNQDAGARIDGNIVANESGVFPFTFSFGEFFSEPQTPSQPMPRFTYTPDTIVRTIGRWMWRIVQTFGLALIAVLLALFMAKPMNRVAKTITDHTALSLGLGALTIIVVPVLLIVIAFTCILAPVTVLGFIALPFLILYGWFSLALLTGNLIANLFKTKWVEPLSVGIGALVLSLVAWLIGSVPCVGWIIPVLLAAIGLGAVLLSKFGTQLYQPQAVNPPKAPAPQKEYSLPLLDIDESSQPEDMQPLDIDEIPPKLDE